MTFLLKLAVFLPITFFLLDIGQSGPSFLTPFSIKKGIAFSEKYQVIYSKTSRSKLECAALCAKDYLCCLSDYNIQNKMCILSSCCQSLTVPSDGGIVMTKENFQEPLPANGYFGCYLDGPNHNRQLPDKFTKSSFMSLARCKTFCNGFRYLGLQFRDECFCGNQLHCGYFPKISESLCNYACADEPNRNCGGSRKSSVYYV